MRIEYFENGRIVRVEHSTGHVMPNWRPIAVSLIVGGLMVAYLTKPVPAALPVAAAPDYSKQFADLSKQIESLRPPVKTPEPVKPAAAPVKVKHHKAAAAPVLVYYTLEPVGCTCH